MTIQAKLRKELIQLKLTTEWLGFSYANGEYSIIVVMYSMTLLFLVINSALYVIYRWDEPDSRVNGLKGLVVYIMCVVYLSTFLMNWNNSKLLLDTVENGLYKFPYRYSPERQQLERSIHNDMIRLNTVWYHAITGYITMVVISPITVFIFRISQHNIGNITVDMLYTAIPFYYPEGYETFLAFLTAFVLQSFFFIYGIRNGYLAIVSAFASMQLIEGELKLIRLSVEEIDRILANSSAVDSGARKTFNVYLQNEIGQFLTYLVKHHHNIYRKVNDVTKGIQMVAFGLNSGLSILLCTVIYTLVKKDEIMLKLQEAVLCFFVIFCFYCYDLMGENVSTEDENLRKALYQSDWIDKPKWFKKVLQIMMARTNKQIEMKSTGLFVLNLSNFLREGHLESSISNHCMVCWRRQLPSKQYFHLYVCCPCAKLHKAMLALLNRDKWLTRNTVQAAYSYYNVLSNLKS